MTTTQSRHIRMKMWQPDGSSGILSKPPEKCLTVPPDAKKSTDQQGHFYFREKKIPVRSGTHNVVFHYSDNKGTFLCTNTVVLLVTPSSPNKLVPVGIPGTPTVSNTQKSSSRVLIRSLKLQLKDQYGNDAGDGITGKVSVTIIPTTCDEIPKLVGNVSSIEVVLNNGVAQLSNLMIQENSPGKDGQEYILRCQVIGQGLEDIEPYDQSFFFYNDAKKQTQMSQLTKQRDELFQTIRTYNGFFETTQQLIKEMKISVHEAQTGEQHLRSELRRQNIPATQLNSIANVDGLVSQRIRERDTILHRPRRQCGLAAPPRDRDVIGKIAHLATIENDDIARVLSWHMASDMDCVVTRTNTKAMEVYRVSNGRQQVLPLDSIYRKNLPDWNKPLPHLRGRQNNFRPKGNPVFARNLLVFTKDKEECKVVFGMLLGDTIILDNLQDANDYRQEVTRISHCPTLLTREGDRIRSNGKFGGVQNRALPIDKLKGAVFGAPLPIEYHALCTQIDTLQNYRQSMIKRLNADKELQEQLQNENTPEMKSKRREYHEAEEMLKSVEKHLGMSPTSGFSPIGSPRARAVTRLRQDAPIPLSMDEDEPISKRARSTSSRTSTPPGTPVPNGLTSDRNTPTRTTRRSAASPTQSPTTSKRLRRT
ncbi:structural maintenance of chromosomes flexible hinge domain-containing protein 1-like [Saccoglossus kowalevskii]|uniref:Structural maintenance of chromosomes flexible hinge domain-containing protein 1-like n=1 Tax=Saccoglossus kowalevskii TaxID=10224 RepID=A0ABM0H0J3_SACKO|nr:PREDICTED: structural maintenance of chromosomes flexible hinge domain-containing protein 1-like [Saccoglossus kowalevskii]